MASESAEGESVSVELPAELAEWLHDTAEGLDVRPATLLRQLLSSYRTTAELAVEVDGEYVEVAFDESGAAEALVEPVVEAAVVGATGGDGVDVAAADDLDRVSDVAAEAARDAVADETADRLSDVEARLDALEGDLDEKITNVRNRVIEVKRETDAKASADHDHGEIQAVTRQLEELKDDVTALSSTVSAIDTDAAPARLDQVEADLGDVEDRLTTVAWIVRDLREAQESDTGDAALAELKRDAAAADVARAKCENCGEGVDISLLTEPACPHCEATVSTVEPASGFFSKPTLRVASQLTAGETR
jgi:hypothetical protein